MLAGAIAESPVVATVSGVQGEQLLALKAEQEVTIERCRETITVCRKTITWIEKMLPRGGGVDRQIPGQMDLLGEDVPGSLEESAREVRARAELRAQRALLRQVESRLAGLRSGSLEAPAVPPFAGHARLVKRLTGARDHYLAVLREAMEEAGEADARFEATLVMARIVRLFRVEEVDSSAEAEPVEEGAPDDDGLPDASGCGGAIRRLAGRVRISDDARV
ncbi:hypothetical protein GC173_11415 [bacterium]|nr:hypothetical protein [bacterium]